MWRNRPMRSTRALACAGLRPALEFHDNRAAVPFDAFPAEVGWNEVGQFGRRARGDLQFPVLIDLVDVQFDLEPSLLARHPGVDLDELCLVDELPLTRFPHTATSTPVGADCGWRRARSCRRAGRRATRGACCACREGSLRSRRRLPEPVIVPGTGRVTAPRLPARTPAKPVARARGGRPALPGRGRPPAREG